MKKLLHFLKLISTARNNRTPSLVRFLALCFAANAVLMSSQFLALAAFATLRGDPFDASGYAMGVAAILTSYAGFLGALGAALRWSMPANAGNDDFYQQFSPGVEQER